MEPRTLRNWLWLGALSVTAMAMACQCFGDVTAVGAAYQDGSGWTQLPANADTFYVSNSIGNDTNNGLSPTDEGGGVGPKQTLSAGKALMGDGDGDHLLLKRGDTWTDEQFGELPAGADEDNMALIGAYGTGARPKVLVTANQSGVTMSGSGAGHFAIIGIEFQPNNRQIDDGGNGLAVNLLNGFGNILVEDCKISEFGNNISIQASNSSTTAFPGVTIRRNIIHDSWNAEDHSQGMFLNKINGLLIEENICYHNGWTDDWQDTATLSTATTTAFTNGDTLTINCVRYGEYTAADDAQYLDLEFVDTNDASGTVASVTIVPESNGANIRVSLDLTTGVASNAVATAITAYDSGNTFSCTSSGTANLVVADAGTLTDIFTAGLGLSANPTIFNHSIYISEGQVANRTRDVTIRGNILAEASNHSAKMEPTQGTLDFYDNLCIANGAGGQFGMGGGDTGVQVDGLVQYVYNNVWTEGIAIANANNLGPEFQSVLDGYFRNNVVSNRDATDGSGGSWQFIVNDHVDGVGIRSFDIADNVFYNLRGPFQFLDPEAAAAEATTTIITGNTFSGNKVVLPTGQTDSAPLFETDWASTGEMVYSGNNYYSTNSTATGWFEVEDSAISTATWQSTYEADATFTEPSFTAATRTASTFAVAEGYADRDAWIADLLTQDASDWDTSIMAEAVNDYIRAGFDVTEFTPSSNKKVLLLK